MRLEKHVIHPPGLTPPGPLSPVVRAGDLIFVSGCSGARKDGTLAPDVRDQTAQAFENIRYCLEAAGGSLDNIVKTKLFLKDFSLFGAINEVYGRYFGGEKRGTRSSLQPEAMTGPQLVTIEAIATLGETQRITPPGVKPRRLGTVTCVRTGDLIFTGGAVGNYNWDQPWRYGADLESQTTQMMENIGQWLKACGSSVDQLVRVLLMVNDRTEMGAMEAIYRRYFRPERLPARIAFEHPSSGPVFNELVEIYTVATVGTKDVIRVAGVEGEGASASAVRAGGLVFVAGLTGRDGAGRLATDIRSQTAQALEKIKKSLEAAGTTWARVVKVLIFVSDIQDLPAVDEVYARYAEVGGYPARTVVQMNPIDPAERITIEAVAVT